MQAAKHGNSTLGIPKSVGAEFVAATENPSELPESAATEKAEGPSDEEKYHHHRKMARKAGSPAARRVHQKLMAHHKNKMGQFK
jgi:hypothetical protein